MSAKTEKVRFKTSDGFTIHGNLFRAGKNAVLLMHQFQLDKSSFDSFAQKLNRAGLTALAIDLRGHGESTGQNGKRRGFTGFSGQDFRDMELDAKAAKQFLEKEGFALFGAVGSSIGANTALNFAALDSAVKKVVLLSPGLEYLGIETAPSAPKVKGSVLCVSSAEDEYSFATCKTLVPEMPNAEEMDLSGAGHGTYMFRKQGLEDEIVKWLLK